jgi:hypothetical protein
MVSSTMFQLRLDTSRNTALISSEVPTNLHLQHESCPLHEDEASDTSQVVRRITAILSSALPSTPAMAPSFPTLKDCLEHKQVKLLSGLGRLHPGQAKWGLPGALGWPPRYSFRYSGRRDIEKRWSGRADLNLSRFAGVSGAGARRRNPEPQRRRISDRRIYR